MRTETLKYYAKKSECPVNTDSHHAFNPELYNNSTPAEVKRDVISYLGEYRLKVPKFKYDLIFGHDKNGLGELTLRDQDRGESLLIKAKRAITEREKRPDSTSRSPLAFRERAEEVGLKKLQEQVPGSNTGDTILWASPPGPKELGYGDYGFLYVGKVKKLQNGEARLAMSAIRIENPTISKFNRVLNQFSEDKVSIKFAEEFLARPKIITSDIKEAELDRALKLHFAYAPDEREQRKFDEIIARVNPIIDDLVTVYHSGTMAEKRKAIFALENYALKLKKEYDSPGVEEKPKENIIYLQKPPIRLYNILNQYGYKPPVERGSCGDTGGNMRSNNLISSGGSSETIGNLYKSDKYGSLKFQCPSCGQTNIRPSDEILVKCQFCGSKEVAC